MKSGRVMASKPGPGRLGEGGGREGRMSGRVEPADIFAVVASDVRRRNANDCLRHTECAVSHGRISDRQARQAASQLSGTGRSVLSSVSRTRMMTGDQLRRLQFPSGDSGARVCRRQLRALAEFGLLVRLNRRVGGVRAGSAGYVYALDRLGQRVVTGSGPAGGRRIRRPWTPSASFIGHVLAVAELYVRLVEAARSRKLELLQFDAEPWCWRTFSGPGGGRLTLKPDAYIRTGAGRFEDLWFTEVDLGTESRVALMRKLRRYRQFWSSGREQARTGAFPRVLLLANSDERRSVLVDVAAAQPPESWQLFWVRLLDEGAAALQGSGA